MKWISFTFLACLGAATTQPTRCFEYDGELDGKPIGMTLRDNGSGCYFYYSECKDIAVEGTLPAGDADISGKLGSKVFHVSKTYSGSWEPGKRYAGAGFDDERAVNDFMVRFQAAILKGDADQAAKMIRFPIKVWIDGKRVQVASQGFRDKFDRIFPKAFVERIRLAPPCHMFSRDQGVMLGQGEIWVAPVVDKGNPAVIAINNDIGARRR